jgi:hypothetical protein
LVSRSVSSEITRLTPTGANCCISPGHESLPLSTTSMSQMSVETGRYCRRTGMMPDTVIVCGRPGWIDRSALPMSISIAHFFGLPMLSGPPGQIV